MKKLFILAFATFSFCGLSLFANGTPLETKDTETENPIAVEDSASDDSTTSTRLLGCGVCPPEDGEEKAADSRFFLVDEEEEEAYI